MKKYSRQFAASVIASVRRRLGPTAGLRLSLVFLYVVTIALAIVLASRAASASVEVSLIAAIIGIALSHWVLVRFEQKVSSHARLISDVTHDLRNSLAIMKMTGEVQMLRGNEMTGEESRRFIENEMRELSRMQSTLERLTGHVFSQKRTRANISRS